MYVVQAAIPAEWASVPALEQYRNFTVPGGLAEARKVAAALKLLFPEQLGHNGAVQLFSVAPPQQDYQVKPLPV